MPIIAAMGKHAEGLTQSQIEARRAEIKAAHDALDAESADLDAAERVLLRLKAANGKPAKIPSKTLVPVSKNEAVIALSFADMKITQAAETLLKEGENEPMHYGTLAKEAVARGYSPRQGTDEKSVAWSFWHTMKRHPDKFEKTGSGFFRLKGFTK